jgi:hypothetical protein
MKNLLGIAALLMPVAAFGADTNTAGSTKPVTFRKVATTATTPVPPRPCLC